MAEEYPNGTVPLDVLIDAMVVLIDVKGRGYVARNAATVERARVIVAARAPQAMEHIENG